MQTAQRRFEPGVIERLLRQPQRFEFVQAVRVLQQWLARNGVPPERAYIRKIPSPAQAEKLLGAKKKSVLEGYTERPVRGTNLVRSTNTTRPAIPPAVDRHFDVLD